ncbi:MAG: hypothetical protein P8O16_00360 [Algoriphagus sp.]|uniref:hypothetical protein n=1 Tax=Algoriphagus sp. TaxID=1872435 RepID=UPI0026225521|nr:hypothetical protein [Algoriphagus sp.]MDG1275699.1 hypothetical protein [Algoriphagus sp.]
MKKILIVLECINKNRSSEGIASVNFLNSIDLKSYEIHAVYYQYPQFDIDKPDWLNKGIKLHKISNDILDFSLSKNNKIKNFFSSYFGIVPLKEYRVLKFKRKISQLIKKEKFDLIFIRTIATSGCSHRAVSELSPSFDIPILSYFNDPIPYCLMPYPYSNGYTNNPNFDLKEKKIIKAVIKKSTAIASPSQKLNELFLDFSQDPEKKTFIFPHIFYEEVLSEEEDLSEFLAFNKINITHCGSLLSQRDPSGLLKAFELFLDENPEFLSKISLNFFGPVTENHFPVFKKFKYQDCLNVIDKRFSHSKSLALMKKSDLFLLLESSFQQSPFMPVKLAEVIGLNKIFLSLAPVDSETRRILGPNYPLQTEALNIDEILRILNEFFSNKLDLKDIQGQVNILEPYILPSTVNKELDNVFEYLKDIKCTT